jgi:hypothetical protein
MSKPIRGTLPALLYSESARCQAYSCTFLGDLGNPQETTGGSLFTPVASSIGRFLQ